MLKTIDIRPVKEENGFSTGVTPQVKKYIFKNLAQTKSNIPSFKNNVNSMVFYNIRNSTKNSLNMNKEVLNFYK
jgi:hypothetical protein